MAQPQGIQIAPYAFKRGEEDFWPAVAIFSIDESGKETQLFYAQPGYGKGYRAARFATEQEALEEAKQISAAHFDGSGRLMVSYRQQIYPASIL